MWKRVTISVSVSAVLHCISLYPALSLLPQINNVNYGSTKSITTLWRYLVGIYWRTQIQSNSNPSCNLQKATHQWMWHEQVSIKAWLFGQSLQGFTVTKDKCAIILIRSYRPQSSTCATYGFHTCRNLCYFQQWYNDKHQAGRCGQHCVRLVNLYERKDGESCIL